MEADLLCMVDRLTVADGIQMAVMYITCRSNEGKKTFRYDGRNGGNPAPSYSFSSLK